jgi:hypothetical protein
MSKTIFFSLVMMISLLTVSDLEAQNCSVLIDENINIGGTQILKTKSKRLVVRGDYSYTLIFMHTERGVQAKVSSHNGVEFNQGDEVIFMDKKGKRMSYRFIEMGELKRTSGAPVHHNILQLDLAAIEWFSKTAMTTLYFKNNVSSKMFKFTVNGSRQADFRNLAICFLAGLDKSNAINVALTGNNKTSKTGGGGKPRAGQPISSTSAGVRQVVDISLLNDEELSALKKELRETKERIRAEIEAEKAKGEQIKSNLRTEVAAVREFAEAKKAEYANEVLDARKKSSGEIEKTKQEIASSVANARTSASTEIEKISANVAESKTVAAAAIQEAKLKSAQEVVDAQTNAAAEIKG